MDVRRRLFLIKTIEKMESIPVFAEKLGVKDISVMKEEEKNKNETCSNRS